MDAPESLTSAAKGMRMQADTLLVIAENLANPLAPGFRARAAAFTSFESELQTPFS